MRLSTRRVLCSVAAWTAVACSGTTVNQVDSRGDTGGAAGNPQSARSTAGNGGLGAEHSGGNATAAAAGAAASPGTIQGGGTSGIGSATDADSTRAGSAASVGGGSGSPPNASTTAAAAGSGGGISASSAAPGGSTSTGGTSATSTTAAAPPSITSVSPTSGIVTTTVVITGQNFGSEQGASTVTVAGSAVTPSYWSNTSIELPIPRSLYPGLANIVVTVGGKASNGGTFDVLLPRTIYINKADRSATGNAVAAFSLTSFGTVAKLQNSPFPTGDTGTSGGIDLTAIVLHRPTRRLFALNEYSVSAFDIDPVTGQLTRTPNSPASTGAAGASGMAVNAAGNLVFVTSVCSPSDNCRYTNPSISVFKVSPTGVLSAVSATPFTQNAGGGGIRIPALIHGEQLLVATGDFDRAPPFNYLVVNTVDSSSGALSPVTGSPFAVGTHSRSGRADPTGTWYYLCDEVPQLTGYAFQNSGAPVLLSGMPIATRTTSTSPNSIAITSDGASLYMGSRDSNEVSVFTLNAGSAALDSLSPYTLEGVSTMSAIAVSRNGTQLVVADSTSGQLMVYPITSGVPYSYGQGSTFEDVGGASGLVVSE